MKCRKSLRNEKKRKENKKEKSRKRNEERNEKPFLLTFFCFVGGIKWVSCAGMAMLMTFVRVDIDFDVSTDRWWKTINTLIFLKTLYNNNDNKKQEENEKKKTRKKIFKTH